MFDDARNTSRDILEQAKEVPRGASRVVAEADCNWIDRADPMKIPVRQCRSSTNELLFSCFSFVRFLEAGEGMLTSGDQRVAAATTSKFTPPPPTPPETGHHTKGSEKANLGAEHFIYI